MSAPLTVVIPALEEARRLPLLLADLARGQGLIDAVIVVDGGSGDATPHASRLAGAWVLHASANRGAQLQAGAAAATAPWLWLLHADGRLPPDWPDRLQDLLAVHGVTPAKAARPVAWYGTLRIDLPGLQYRCLEMLVALRSCWRQRPYGDQGLLLLRADYLASGGVLPLPLMEDLEFAQRWARQGRWRPLGLAVRVDGRRWRRLGLLGTAWANAALRRAWRRGVPPETLARRYRA